MPDLDCDLVLEGGGVKGIALIGAVDVLEAAGYRVRRVAGTSAGAIVGSLVAAGMPAQQRGELMRSVDYRRFQDKDGIDHLGVFGRGLSLLFENGIYEGNYLREWLGEQLATCGVRTFTDLRITPEQDPGSNLPPERSYRLVVMTSDISGGRLLRLPWAYPEIGMVADDTPVADAVRASMSIPFFYEPVKLAGHAGTLWLVDGGMLSNFPVEVFDRTDGRPSRWPTFGVKLSAKPGSQQRSVTLDGPLSMARAMVGTMSSFYDRMHLDDPSVVDRTIFVDTFGVQSTDFDLDRDTSDRLYASGKAAAERFLGGWDWTAFQNRYHT